MTQISTRKQLDLIVGYSSVGVPSLSHTGLCYPTSHDGSASKRNVNVNDRFNV